MKEGGMSFLHLLECSPAFYTALLGSGVGELLMCSQVWAVEITIPFFFFFESEWDVSKGEKAGLRGNLSFLYQNVPQ